MPTQRFQARLQDQALKHQTPKDKSYGPIVHCIQDNTYSKHCNRKQSWYNKMQCNETVFPCISTLMCQVTLRAEALLCFRAPMLCHLLEHCDVSVMRHEALQCPNFSTLLCSCRASCCHWNVLCHNLQRTSWRTCICRLKHLQNKQPWVLLHHVNLRFSPSKWRWVRSIYVGQGGIQRDFEQFLLRYASLELDHWLRLWIPHSPSFWKTRTRICFGDNMVSPCPDCKKSCEAMRDVFLSWQSPCLLDLGRLLADSLEMFLTLLLAQSFTVKNFLFICFFFWPATQTQRKSEKDISNVIQASAVEANQTGWIKSQKSCLNEPQVFLCLQLCLLLLRQEPKG